MTRLVAVISLALFATVGCTPAQPQPNVEGTAQSMAFVILTQMATQVPPTETPKPATSTPIPTPTPEPPTATATATPTATPVPPTPTPTQTPLPRATVNHWPYMAVDGHGAAAAGALASALASLGNDVFADLKLAKELASGAIVKLDYGASVEVLEQPGPRGTHVRVLTGRNAGKTGSVLNHTLAN